MPALCQGRGKPCAWPSEFSLLTTETAPGESTEWLTHLGCRVPVVSCASQALTPFYSHNTPRSALLLSCPFSR